MTEVIEETVIVMAYPEDRDGPVVHIFGGEVLFTEDGEFVGWDPGDWWESLGLDTGEAPAALDDIDAELAAHGYRRTSNWIGPVITRRGERYTANGIGRIEPIV
ncbi:hypothetical protein [Nocardia sp. 852002-51244_SCH5132740]|uniref:hypothetical protein n=1 Tax=Nocardia sp. 852002-51244_SCH5132740 TaxID=1834099 RepID=UPI0007EC285A|nr:hypothetical protein [Nocardia sp. 852002-51244_SCH5132740]OBB48984.1 hypothetical protein A5748_20745 [Nocardia sp. 852002-51244_SCH5132740]